MIVENPKGTHVCNDEGNYVIIKNYNSYDVNDTYLID
jgi:hypothetical protein